MGIVYFAEEQWQYYQSYVGGRMSSTNTSEVFGEGMYFLCDM